MEPTALPTMLVKYADGRLVRINTRDFDPGLHFDPTEAAPAEVAPADEPVPADVDAPADESAEEDAPAKRRGRR